MSERQPSTDQPIVIAIGGTGASRSMVKDYYEHLVTRSARDIAPNEKLFALPNDGKGKLQDTYDELQARIAQFRAQHIGRKVVALGHSQGGVHAARLGVDGRADAAVTLAAPLRGGVLTSVPGFVDMGDNMRALRDEFAPAAPFMRTLREDMATQWPVDVPLYVVAATTDLVVPAEAQFGVRLPDGIQPHEYVVVPPALELMGGFAVKLTSGASSHIRHLHSDFPVDHLTIPYATGMPRFIDRVVDELQ